MQEMDFSDAPVNIQTRHIGTEALAWHPYAELLFVLRGEAELLLGDRRYTLATEDVCLINEHQPHMIAAEDCDILSICLQLSGLRTADDAEEYVFELNSSGNTDSDRFHYIRCLMAQLVKTDALENSHYRVLSLAYLIFSHLVERFRVVPQTERSVSAKNRRRIAEIAAYIEEHACENLSLLMIAEAFGLSVPYLASFFEKHMGQTVMTYYNTIRLRWAVTALLTSDRSIEAAALSSGFHDARSFSSLFKKRYGCLPSIYRKQHRLLPADKLFASEPQTGIKLDSLAKYLKFYAGDAAIGLMPGSAPIRIDGGAVDYAAAGTALTHSFKTLCCVGSAKQFLYAEVQEMVRSVQREIGYRYVKFHGILSDELMVYSELADGTPVYSFSLLDKVLDFLMSVRLKPLFQLSFMPRALASDPERNIDMQHFNTSPPKDMQKWVGLVEAVLRHVIERYGLAEARSWLYCVWNEPDSSPALFGWEDTEAFYEFYRQTLLAAKRVDGKLLFGTPSLLVAPENADSWTGRFLAYCNSHDCVPDFINIHYYDNSFHATETDDGVFSQENTAGVSPLNSDPFAFTKFLDELQKTQRRFKMSAMPVYLTEWNLTISHRDLINDTCFKACYLIKNLLENYDRLHSYGYWCLTDLIEEMPIPDELYHGGLGMFTYNGIPKAHYNGFRFLTRLGDTLLAKGPGYFITRKESGVVMLLYNYEHYSNLFASGRLFDMTIENRYTPFTEMNPASFQLTLRQLPAAACLIKESYVNQHRGSSYDVWIRMGAQPLTRQEDLDILRQESQPGMYLHKAEIVDGALALSFKLEPLEVRLVEIAFT